MYKYKTIIKSIILAVKHKLNNIDINDDNIHSLLTTYNDNQEMQLILITNLINKYRLLKTITDIDKKILHDYIIVYIKYSIKIKILNNILINRSDNIYGSIKENLYTIDKHIDNIIDKHTANDFSHITNLEYLVSKLKHTDNNIYLTIKLLLNIKL